jgi:hypothetical protein
MKCTSTSLSVQLSPILAYLAIWAGLFWLHSTWAALLGFHAVIIILLLIHKPNIPIALLFKSKNIKWIILSVFLCGSSGILLYFLWPIFGIANDLPAQLRSLGLASFTWPAFIAYFSLINPLIEEYFWRGFLGSNSKNLYMSDPLYAGYHALVLWGKVHPFSILFAVTVLILIGWFWRQIAREDDGLFAPVLGHMAADFSITLCVYWMCMFQMT